MHRAGDGSRTRNLQIRRRNPGLRSRPNRSAKRSPARWSRWRESNSPGPDYEAGARPPEHHRHSRSTWSRTRIGRRMKPSGSPSPPAARGTKVLRVTERTRTADLQGHDLAPIPSGPRSPCRRRDLVGALLRRPPGNRTRSSRHIRAVPSQLARGLCGRGRCRPSCHRHVESAALPLSYTSNAWSRACSHRPLPGFNRALLAQYQGCGRGVSSSLCAVAGRRVVTTPTFGSRLAAKEGIEPPASMGNGHPLYR